MISSIKKELVEGVENISVTENGAIGFKTTGSYLVDMTFKLSSYRMKSKKAELYQDFMNAINSCKTNADIILLAKWLFYVRDIREGSGERSLFGVCFPLFVKFLVKNKTEATQLFNIINIYGRYDDLINLLLNEDMKKYHYVILDSIKHTFMEDLEKAENGKSITLLAKWMPSIIVPSKKKRNKIKYEKDLSKDIKMQKSLLAKGLAKFLGMSEFEYRKNLSFLRTYLDIVEKKISTKNYLAIDYSQVPSKASLLYKNAFYKHDEDNYKSYLESLKKGETKINASTLFPHEIVSKYQNYWTKEDTTLEELWKALPRNVYDDGQTMVVRDGSGSMMGLPMDVADALTLLISEQCKGEFENCFITFSSRPKIVDMSNMKDALLKDKLKFLRNYNDCSNTDIEKTFDLILNTAKNQNLSQEDLPKRILIISDMEFDRATTMHCGYGYEDEDVIFNNKAKTLFENIAEKFEKEGYHLPKLCFWNVYSRTNTIPVKESEYGVSLVSGFSTNIFKMVISNELDPLKQLEEMLNVERYSIIEDILSE